MLFIDFLRDVTSGISNFRNDLGLLYIFKEKSEIIATANHPKMLLLYRIKPIEDLSREIDAPMYIGALPYLNSLLSSALMNDSPLVDITYNNNNDCVTSMRFTSKRLDANFQCTNPEILNEKERRSQFNLPDEAISFQFTKNMRKEFEEVARFNTPKADMRLFTLSFDGSYVRAIFGTGKHTTNLVLTDEITGCTDNKVQKLVSLDRFKSMIKLVSDNNGEAGFHPNAFWVSFTTPVANHLIVIPTVREQPR